MTNVFKVILRVVNFVTSKGINRCQITDFFCDTESEHEVLRSFTIKSWPDA